MSRPGNRQSEAERIFRSKFLPLLEMKWILKTEEIKYFGLLA
ncbi:hypothetical protein SNOG_05628 [Parastagonospora nodorum SN15]|uniref:Uncharacterized protein n=1 Tax=Phaeosphaeria nodorum (strain SN15 / ATCC MYA-4574 / FGSC 10173) TaxID=321614 RepID=Q0URI6_PHANO|nr:hypothetical protein SNOG_05628 [Parastagonospora nodorum SN15]EAT86692.1 hypothetical protein SNOG_05628 [Parastagonospora nodorum SN15]